MKLMIFYIIIKIAICRLGISTILSNKQISMFSKYSLMEGALPLDLGAIHNARFFGLYTIRSFKEDETENWFTPDQANDGGNFSELIDDKQRLSFALCKLFVSPVGVTLNISRISEANLARILDAYRIKRNETDK